MITRLASYAAFGAAIFFIPAGLKGQGNEALFYIGAASGLFWIVSLFLPWDK